MSACLLRLPLAGASERVGSFRARAANPPYAYAWPPHSNRPVCQSNTASTTTTPAFEDALFSPRPKARYPVSSVIAGIPSIVFQYILIWTPDRILDLIALKTNAGNDAVESYKQK